MLDWLGATTRSLKLDVVTRVVISQRLNFSFGIKPLTVVGVERGIVEGKWTLDLLVVDWLSLS